MVDVAPAAQVPEAIVEVIIEAEPALAVPNAPEGQAVPIPVDPPVMEVAAQIPVEVSAQIPPNNAVEWHMRPRTPPLPEDNYWNIDYIASICGPEVTAIHGSRFVCANPFNPNLTPEEQDGAMRTYRQYDRMARENRYTPWSPRLQH